MFTNKLKKLIKPVMIFVLAMFLLGIVAPTFSALFPTEQNQNTIINY